MPAPTLGVCDATGSDGAPSDKSLGPLAQQPAGAKAEGGEITAAPLLLEKLVLQGQLFTGDAIFTQRSLCQQITDGQGDYLLSAKDNQPKLVKEIEDVFRSPGVPFFRRAKPSRTADEWKREPST